MLHSCAEYLTHTLYRHCPLSEEKRPVFVYGFELSLSTLSSILSIILLSIIFKNVYSSLLFLYIFFFLRLFSGGYHAPTYSRCFILTNAIFAFGLGCLQKLYCPKQRDRLDMEQHRRYRNGDCGKACL